MQQKRTQHCKAIACVPAKSTSVRSTLCNPMDCSLTGSSVHEILQARQEYWSGLLFPTPGDLPDTGIKPLHLLHWPGPGGGGASFPLGPPRMPKAIIVQLKKKRFLGNGVSSSNTGSRTDFPSPGPHSLCLQNLQLAWLVPSTPPSWGPGTAPPPWADQPFQGHRILLTSNFSTLTEQIM